MKKLLAFLLCFCLMLSTSAPVFAAGSADSELEQITEKVKSTLGLDTGAYSSFTGEYSEQELTKAWYLHWDGTGGSLAISALNSGEIISYSLMPNQSSSAGSQSVPSFPKGDAEEAKASAQAFLNKVLMPYEKVSLGEPSGFDSINSTSYRFSGYVLVNDLPSPLFYSITVNASDNTVTRFSKDAASASYLGGIPSPSPSVSFNSASGLLKDTLSLKPEYVMLNKDEPAVLCYLPDSFDDYFVDASTGTLVNLSNLQNKMFNGAMGSNSAEASDSALSDAEQEGIAQLEGILSSSEIDKSLRSISEYGLDEYTFISADFFLGDQDENGQASVSCRARYSRDENGKVFSRTFTVNARTGEVIRIDSNIPREKDYTAALSQGGAYLQATAFLEKYYSSHYAQMSLYDPGEDSSSAPEFTFIFAQKANGYFFPDNYYVVSVDSSDGSISGFSFVFDETVTFQNAENIITPQQAVDAWMNTYTVTLGYLSVPEEITGSDDVSNRLRTLGLDYYYHLRLCYYLYRQDSLMGINAHTGNTVDYPWKTQDTDISYGDISGHWSESYVNRLSQFGIGYRTENLSPDTPVTQWDMVCLLFSMQTSALDPYSADASEKDSAYFYAYSMGVLSPSERDDSSVLTRSTAVRYLLNYSGFKTAASLKGIYACSYPDKSLIAEDDIGYAALAQGLGIISGEYAPERQATRAEVFTMLCRLMDR